MKKVKTRKFLWALLPMMAAALMTTACSSDDSTSVTPKPAADQTVKSIPYTVTVGQGTTTRATVASDDVTLQFAAGDELYVENKSANVYGRLTLQSGAGAATGATFSGDLYYTGSEPADDLQLTATLVGASDELATKSDNKVTGFTYPTSGNICATMADAVAKFSKLQGSNTYGAKSFALSQETAFLKFSITLSGTTAGSDVPVVINNGSSTIGTGTVTATAGTSSVKADFVLALATGTVIAAGSKMNVGTKEIVYSSAEMTLSGGFYEYEEEVPGSYFTANSSGLKVAFSQGNLQATYNGSTWTWAFAAHQYDYIGNASGNTKVTDSYPFISENATVDLFGWVGASSNFTGVAQYGITSSKTLNSEDGYGYVADESMKAEWNSTNLTITNGGTYTWRTLTGREGGEWDWIIGQLYYADPGNNCRASGATVNGTSNARFTHATINTDGTPVNGMILFPDGCKINSSSATSWGKINEDSEWGTKCTTAQWTHLEELGCVFLPAAGCRKEAEVEDVGTDGYYWSSSYRESYLPYESNTQWAHNMYFGSWSMNPTGDTYRYRGFSVRLVREVPSN